ncbi:DUF2188 domain-containing protein [Vineibacter terrae]|uniref:DUF2188 domain-containing protein n=1 Tax=Vineibacter terrae TaxID=2586908 RepID=A0A5C8PWQ7_9HYPH|nr:DUF2188 domain-containing protein [Vineibacter terrae]TXL82403.1 DUF2188 domain-containing protein [Vineibacter terrae]HEX2891908.1 DUF2188 domain-containing protein [Vineibacter terrae]
MSDSTESSKGRQGRKGASPTRTMNVIPTSDGWSLKRSSTTGARVYASKAEATKAAQAVLSIGGGELRIHGRNGKISETFTLGRNAIAKISAVEGLHLTEEIRDDFREFDRRRLSDDERRRLLVNKYGRKSA